jgi:hypothetical protein
MQVTIVWPDALLVNQLKIFKYLFTGPHFGKNPNTVQKKMGRGAAEARQGG